jgi:hypothetical protein
MHARIVPSSRELLRLRVWIGESDESYFSSRALPMQCDYNAVACSASLGIRCNIIPFKQIALKARWQMGQIF